MNFKLSDKLFLAAGLVASSYISGIGPVHAQQSPIDINTSAIGGLVTINTIEGTPAPSGSVQSTQSVQQPPGNATVTFNSAPVSVQIPAGNLLSANNSFLVGTREGRAITGVTRVVNNHAFLNSSFTSDASGTQLILTRNQVIFSSLSQTRNQQSVAHVLDAAERRANFAPPVRLLYGLALAEVPNTYAALSGESIADARGAATGAVNLVVGAVRDQLVSGNGNAISTRDGMRVWATFLGGNLNLSAQNNAYGTRSQTWGGMGAVEKQINPTLRMGVAAGGTQTSLSVSGQQGKGQAGFGHVDFYAQKDIDAAYFLGIAGWSFGQTTTSRNVLSSFQSGSFNGQGPNARIEAGYHFAWNSYEFAPYVALQGVWLRQNGMSESVNSFAGLYVNGQTVVSIPLSIGLQAKETARLSADWDLNLRGRAAYVHEFFPSRTITAQFIAIPQSFEASGRPMPSNGLDLGAGLELLNKSGFSLTLAGDALLAVGAIGWRWQAAAGYQW